MHAPSRKSTGSIWWKIPLWTIAGLIALTTATLVFFTFWLTPGRLSHIVSEELSQRTEADFEIQNLRFTFWSTFPRFCLQSDSIFVRSRTLDSIPAEIRRQLPSDADFVGSMGRFKGGVNIANLLRGHLRLHDVEAYGIRLNLIDINDSISNYKILPENPEGMKKVPVFSANRIELLSPRSITYRSMESGLTLDAELDSMNVSELPRRRDSYDIEFAGRIGMSDAGLDILSGFPFRMQGQAILAFNPFKIKFRDFGVSLGNMIGKANLALDTSEGGNISDFSYTAESFRLMGLLKFLPPKYTPRLSGFDQNLSLRLSARLLGQYHLSSSTMPSVEVTARVEDGDLSYAFDSGDTLSLRHEGMSARFVFDGAIPDSSYVEIPDFTLRGSGIDINVNARIKDILASPRVDARLKALINAAHATTGLSAVRPYSPKGNFDIDAEANFAVSSTSQLTVTDFRMTADARGTKLSMRTPDGTGISIDSLTIGGNIKGSASGIAASKSDIALKGMKLAKNGVSLTIGNTWIKALYDSLAPAPIKSRMPASDYPDRRWLESIDHTPVAINFKCAPGVASFLNSRQASLDVSTDGGNLAIRNYPDRFILAPCRLRANADSVAIDELGFRSGGSCLRMSGSIRSLRKYLTLPGTQPLQLNLALDIDTLNINNVARAADKAMRLVGGTGFRKKSSDEVTRADMTSWLIPRNLDARITLSGDRVVWTNLDFSDLSGSINVARGRANIDTIRLKSTFCEASLSAVYNTADIQQIGLKAYLDVDSIDFEKMLSKFQTFRARWPELENLSGMLGISGSMAMHIYPDMSIEMPSLAAALRLSGRDLKIRQNKFIHHVCEMMAIHSHDDLHIANIDVDARVYDNLLQLYPATFEFPGYRLMAVGLNDFAGNLDYHLGVLKSPVPFEFGINIEGSYHHPKLRFGGAGWNHRRGAGISADIMKSFTINFVKEVKSGMNEFMYKAATE